MIDKKLFGSICLFLLCFALLPTVRAESSEQKDKKPFNLQKILNRLNRVVRHEVGVIRQGYKARTLPDIEPRFKAKTYKKASLTLQKGVPVVHLYGTPWEMGYQYGKLLSWEIRTLQRRYLDFFMSYGKKRKEAMKIAYQYEKHIPQRFIREMKGMAKGSGLTYDEVLLAHTFVDIFQSQLLACSTVGIEAKKSQTGQTMFGRNLDFPTLGVAHKFSMIVVYHPKNKASFASITWPGLMGVLTGINEHGLSLGMLAIQFEKFNDAGFPMVLLWRHLLEEAKSVPEALAILKKTQLSVASNLTLVDSKVAAVAELVPQDKSFRFAKMGKIYSVNHFQSPSIKKYIPSMTYTSSFVRGRIIRYYFSQSPEEMDVAYVQRILAAVCVKGVTMQSMVFIPHKRHLYLSVGSEEAAREKFDFFDLGPMLKRKAKRKEH